MIVDSGLTSQIVSLNRNARRSR